MINWSEVKMKMVTHKGKNTPIKILIADDNKVLAEVLRDIIESPDRSVEICHDGLEASERIKKENFDLLLLDLVMPKMSGLEVLKSAIQINPNVIVIIITAYASLETAVMAIKEGAYDYIVKPYKLDEMRIVIHRATEMIKLQNKNNELLEELEETYRQLSVLKRQKNVDNLKDLKFYSSNIAQIQSSFAEANPAFIDKLHTLAHLKKDGMLTENEFKEFKDYALEAVKKGIDPPG